jgi:ACR3 family arsenite transporter|tara:strand:+ start:552 stop:1574 length:1023 start_codon:yes stop_codon:yes gene_type:complete
MGVFERYLTIWVACAISLGVSLGSLFPAAFTQVAAFEYAGVNFVVAILIWVMIYPMMVQVDFRSVRAIGSNPKGIYLTLGVNWLIKPFSMALIAYLFFRIFYVDLVDPLRANEYIAGMILLGVAPCTAMVFVWSQLTKGDPNYTLVQVSINDLIMIFAFAPLAGLLLGLSEITVPWNTLIISVLLYVVVPLVAGLLTRAYFLKNNEMPRLDNLIVRFKPLSIAGLLVTVILLFGFQANKILAQPQAIFLIAVPLVIQTYGIFALAYFLAIRIKLSFNIAAPGCMIATSNFFELAVAVAISLFGLNSGASLATVVGVLVEVPVMLSLVAFANKTKHWFDQN